MSYYLNNCTIEYALKRDEVISKALECVSANSHLEILCKQFEVDRSEFEIKLSTLEIGVLIPTQDKIEKWKYKKVSKKGKWGGPDNEFFKKDDEIDYLEEPIVVLHCDYGSESGTYILSGHTRAKKRLDDRKDSVNAIVITTSSQKVHEVYTRIVSNMGVRLGHQPYINDLDVI